MRLYLILFLFFSITKVLSQDAQPNSQDKFNVVSKVGFNTHRIAYTKPMHKVVVNNPTCRDLIFYHLDSKNKKAFLKVWDMTGNLVKIDSTQLNSLGIGVKKDLFNEEGFYLVQIDLNSSSHTEKLIVKCISD